MLRLPLDVVLTVLTLACSLMAVQLVILTFELVRLRRDMLRAIAFFAAAVSGGGWRGPPVDMSAIEDEPTEPRGRRPARFMQAVTAWGPQASAWAKLRAWLRRLFESMRE